MVFFAQVKYRDNESKSKHHVSFYLFKTCSRYVRDWWWWGYLTMVPAENNAKSLSSVNHTTKQFNSIIIIMGLHVWTLALGGLYHGDKFGILLHSGNISNMFEIHTCWNKISQKDGYLHSKMHCLKLDLLWN